MYLYLKAFHLIFVVTWFAELFYIFRLFVYHSQHTADRQICSTFETMEYKLIYYIGHPSMALTIVFASGLIAQNPDLLKAGWLHVKILLGALLIGYQIFAGITRRKFASGDFFISEKACRIINEIPAVLLIAMVLLAILKPF